MKERIIAAFAGLSRTKGFYKVTVDELAVEAGVSKRTIYRYFRSKNEIIEAVIDDFLGKMGREADAAAALRNPDEIFAHVLKNFYEIGRIIINPFVLEDLRVHYPQYWKKIDRFRMGKAQNVIKTFLAVGSRDYTKHIDPHILTAAVLAGIQAVLNPEFLMKNGLTFETAAADLLEFFKHGFINEYKGGGDPEADHSS